MGIISWIVIGIIFGMVASALSPEDPGGPIIMVIVGVVGACLGGFLVAMATGIGLNGFSPWSILLAVIGALILLWIYRNATKGRYLGQL